MGNNSNKETIAAFVAIVAYLISEYLPHWFVSIILLATAIIFSSEFVRNLRGKGHPLYSVFYFSLCVITLILSLLKFGGIYTDMLNDVFNIDVILYIFVAIALVSGLASSYKFGDERKKKLVILTAVLILIYTIFVLLIFIWKKR